MMSPLHVILHRHLRSVGIPLQFMRAIGHTRNFEIAAPSIFLLEIATRLAPSGKLCNIQGLYVL